MKKRLSSRCLSFLLVICVLVTLLPTTLVQAVDISSTEDNQVYEEDVYEAEDGDISTGELTDIVEASNASNGHFVRVGTDIGEYNQINHVNGYDGGRVQMTIRYANGAGHINTKALYVNDEKVDDIQFVPTSPNNDWTTFDDLTVTVELKPGTANTIRLINEAETVYTLRLDKYTIVSEPPLEGTTYYVDSEDGNDDNSGTDIDAPWKSLSMLNEITFQPGDNILLKAGSVWNSEGIVPNGSGEEGSPITLSRYGEGPDPVLNGEGEVTQLIYLRNLSWWIVENLEMTNTAKEEYAHSLMGVRVEAIDAPGGVVSGITLQNLHIHNINGLKSTGEIPFPSLIYFNSGGVETPSIFDNVLVKDCITRDSIPNGLNFYSSHTSNEEYYSTNVIIDNVSGNTAQIYWMLDGAVIQNNTIVNAGGYTPQYNSTLFAAIFPTYSKNLTYQYNEVINTAASGDSQGFDFDLNLKGTNIFQYNYTSGNAGALLVMDQVHEDVEMIYRYNVSHNDGASQFRLGNSNVKVYNNTIYNDKEEILINTWGNAEKPNEFYNNIFVGKTMQMQAEPGKENPIFEYNLFYGFSGPDDSHKINADPLFVDPSSVSGLDTIDGFRLEEGSPAINAGKVIEGNGGQDISGTPLYNEGPDIGAFEYQDSAANNLYEAEHGETVGGASVEENTNASNGEYVGGLDTEAAFIEINNVNGGRGGDFYLRTYYSADSDTSKSLFVNDGDNKKEVHFSAAEEGFEGVATTSISLDEGNENSIVIKNDDNTSGNLKIDRFLLIPVNKVYEAEHGEIGGGAKEESDVSNAWGNGVVSLENDTGAYNKISGVDGYDGGIFNLKIRYANGRSNDSIQGLYVNGNKMEDVILSPTGSPTTFSEITVPVLLRSGNTNIIELKNEGEQEDSIKLDAYTIVKSTEIYEAQNGSLSGGVSIRNNTEASGWNVVHGFDNTNASIKIEPMFALQDGQYRLRIRYSTEEDAVKGLYVNEDKVGDIVFESTRDYFNFDYLFETVELNKGANTLEIRNDGTDTNDIYLDRVEVLSADVDEVVEPEPEPVPSDDPTEPDDVQFIEAEHAEISEGGPSIHLNDQASGGIFVSDMHYSGRYVIWNNVNGGAGGNYELTVGYRTGNDGSRLGVYVNGERQATLELPNTGWTNFETALVDLELVSGYNNRIMLKNDEMPGNVAAALDYFLLIREGVELPPEEIPELGPNLLTNPGFENGNTGWVLGNRFEVTDEEQYSGTYSLKLDGEDTWHRAYKSFDVEPYHTYRVSFYAKSTGNNARVGLRDLNDNVLGERTLSQSNDWTYYEFDVNVQDNARVNILIIDRGHGDFYFDDLSVKRVSQYPDFPGLVRNGEFDSKSTSGWNIGDGFSLSSIEKYTGTSSIRIDGTGSNETMNQKVSISENTNYVLTFMSKALEGNIGYQIKASDGSNITEKRMVTGYERWTEHRLYFNSGPNTEVIISFSDEEEGVGYVDSVQLRESYEIP